MINTNLQQSVDSVLRGLKIDHPVLLGKGGEGWVYQYEENSALKIYPRSSDIEYLRNTQKFQDTLSKAKFSFATPQIEEIGEIDGILYTIEKRLHGTQMDKKIIDLPTADRQRLYRSYYEAIRQVGSVTFANLPYGQITDSKDTVRSESWTDFLITTLDRKLIKNGAELKHKILHLDEKVSMYKALIKSHLKSEKHQLVHSDYFLNNVLVDDLLNISAVLDFSVHAVVGDPLLDIAGVLTWNEIDPHVHPDDYMFLYDVAKSDYGGDIQTFADLYLIFSSFYFSDMDDPSFSIKNLNNENLWDKYR